MKVTILNHRLIKFYLRQMLVYDQNFIDSHTQPKNQLHMDKDMLATEQDD